MSVTSFAIRATSSAGTVARGNLAADAKVLELGLRLAELDQPDFAGGQSPSATSTTGSSLTIAENLARFQPDPQRVPVAGDW